MIKFKIVLIKVMYLIDTPFDFVLLDIVLLDINNNLMVKPLLFQMLSRIGQASGQIQTNCFVKQSYQCISVVSLGYC